MGRHTSNELSRGTHLAHRRRGSAGAEATPASSRLRTLATFSEPQDGSSTQDEPAALTTVVAPDVRGSSRAEPGDAAPRGNSPRAYLHRARLRGSDRSRWLSRGALVGRWALVFASLAAAAIGLGWAAADRTFGAAARPGPVVLASDRPNPASEVPTPASEVGPAGDASDPVATDPNATFTFPSTPGAVSLPPSPPVGAPSATAPALTPPVPAPVLPSASWRDALEVLDQRRSAAFAAGDGAMLAQVYAAGSAPLERDSAALAELADRGLRATGLSQQLDEVTLVSVDTDTATVRVVDQLAPYQLVDAAGTTVESVPGRGPATWVITLTSEPGGWVIAQVVRE